MIDYEALSRRIHEARLLLGLRQEDMAELAKISTSFFGHIERGSRKASMETLVSITCSQYNVLNTSIDKLLNDSLEISLPAHSGTEPLREAAQTIFDWYDRAEKKREPPPKHGI